MKLFALNASFHKPNFVCILQDLKDRNDELTAELEAIKLHLPSLRRKETPMTSSPREFNSRIPVRDGSLMSDYFKGQKRGARSSLSSGKYPSCLYLYRYVCQIQKFFVLIGYLGVRWLEHSVCVWKILKNGHLFFPFFIYSQNLRDKNILGKYMYRCR